MSEAAVDRAALIKALKGIESSIVADAVEHLNVRPRSEGFADFSLRPVISSAEPMIGFAVTATCNVSSGEKADYKPGMTALMKAIDAAPKPAVVVIQELGPHPGRVSLVGGVSAEAWKMRGVVGTVCNGGVRDLADIRRSGLIVFAPGVVVAHGGFFHICDVGVPVDICGMKVANGDLLHGDENGVVSVPEVTFPRLLEGVEQALASDRAGAALFASLFGAPPSGA